MIKIKHLFIIFVFFSFAVGISANEQIGSYMDEYFEVLALAGLVERPALMYKSLSRNTWEVPRESVDHPWKTRMDGEKAWNWSKGVNLNFISPEFVVSYNTSYDRGSNDGAFWQGRGINSMIFGGANLNWKWLSATLAPELWFSQNKEFDLMPSNPSLSQFSYPVGGIDFPQRFGDSPIIAYGLGQSDLRMDIGRLTLGLSHENLWFGSTNINPILMSNNASGFPHVDFGVRKFHNYLGDLEINLVWGGLLESEYFDENDTNDYRLFSALTFGYSPVFLRNLTLGFNRVMYTPWQDLMFYDFIVVLDPTGSYKYGADDRDQMISFTMDWLLPASMFNVYLEWARNDFSPDLRYAISYPQHSQAYTLGFQKLLFTKKRRIISIIAELTELVRSKDVDGGSPSYYIHHQAIQGYTHLGQIMGASIGPGSNSQSLKISYYDRWGRVELQLLRIAYNYDYYYAQLFPASWNPASNELEITAGLKGVIFLNMIDICTEIDVSYFENFNYIRHNDVWNFYGKLSFRYRL